MIMTDRMTKMFSYKMDQLRSITGLFRYLILPSYLQLSFPYGSQPTSPE